MDDYRDNLRHVARPEDPRERRETEAVSVEDWLALMAVEYFSEHAAWGADDDVKADVARAYADYANNTVRNEGKRMVEFYAHTDEAKEVLYRAMEKCSERVGMDIEEWYPVSMIHSGKED